jgi:hypothetical protein
MGLGPTNFPWWTVNGQPIPPWATSEAVIGPQRYLDAPVEETYREVKRRGYDAESALEAMDQEGIDVAIVFRTLCACDCTVSTCQRSSKRDPGKLLTPNSGVV